MNQIGKKVYYDKETGDKIQEVPQRQGFVRPSTVQQDFVKHKALAERVPETVGVIQLNYNQYAQDFAECNGYRVKEINTPFDNLDTTTQDGINYKVIDPKFNYALDVQEVRVNGLRLDESLYTVDTNGNVTFKRKQITDGVYNLVELTGIKTHELEFSYPDPNLPPEEQEVVWQKPLSEEVKEIKTELQATQTAVDFLLMGGM